MSDKLTDQQELFCLEYMKDLNATQAAIRAGYSENSARSIACENLTKPNIQDRVAELKAEQFKRVQIDSDQILAEIAKLGYSDIRGLYNDDGTIKHPKEWSDELGRAVSSIEVEELFDGSGQDRTWIGYTKKVKFWPKDKALDMLGKHKKLFTERHEHTGEISLEQRYCLPAKEEA